MRSATDTHRRMERTLVLVTIFALHTPPMILIGIPNTTWIFAGFDGPARDHPGFTVVMPASAAESR